MPGGGLQNDNVNLPVAAAAKGYPEWFQHVHAYSGWHQFTIHILGQQQLINRTNIALCFLFSLFTNPSQHSFTWQYNFWSGAFVCVGDGKPHHSPLVRQRQFVSMVRRGGCDASDVWGDDYTVNKYMFWLVTQHLSSTVLSLYRGDKFSNFQKLVSQKFLFTPK